MNDIYEYMLGGSLMQLVAYGAMDVYLSGGYDEEFVYVDSDDECTQLEQNGTETLEDDIVVINTETDTVISTEDDLNEWKSMMFKKYLNNRPMIQKN
jgi:hypothetical protein